MTLQEQFRQTVQILLAADEPPFRQREAAIQLFDRFCEVIGLDDRDPDQEATRNTFLDSGKAIALQGAAQCLREYMRTSVFLRGIQAALQQARQRFPGQRLRLLDAGCGPFGLLALPMAVFFSPEEVGFTLLDIHSHTLEAARKLVTTLGLASWVDAYVQADATTWQCPPALRPHVAVSETMQFGLRSEPQVAVTRNLAPQLLPGGLWLPARVTLDFMFMHWITDEGDTPFNRSEPVARLFELTGEGLTPTHGGHLHLPDLLPAQARPGLGTTVQVFGEHILRENDCSLTLPIWLRKLPPMTPGAILPYVYQEGPKPEVRFG